MRVTSRSIIGVLISCSIMYRMVVLTSAFEFATTTVNDEKDHPMAKEEPFWVTSLFSMVCEIAPSICSLVHQIRERFLPFAGEFQARGPKDLIAIISTMLASLLGAILVKLNVLIVLSLISVGIGKLLLLILALKSKIFSNDHSHQHHQPVVYEKVYYPRHHYPHNSQLDEYPSELYQK